VMMITDLKVDLLINLETLLNTEGIKIKCTQELRDIHHVQVNCLQFLKRILNEIFGDYKVSKILNLLCTEIFFKFRHITLVCKCIFYL